MRRAEKVFVMSTILVTALSCQCPPEKPQPERPENVSGWQSRDEHGTRLLGEFVLGVGDSVNNGTLGVSVVAISPPRPCSHEGWYAYPNAVIRFYRYSDSKVLCEHAWIPGSLVLKPDCDAELGFTNMSLAINSNEGWVHLRLLQ